MEIGEHSVEKNGVEEGKHSVEEEEQVRRENKLWKKNKGEHCRRRKTKWKKKNKDEEEEESGRGATN